MYYKPRAIIGGIVATSDFWCLNSKISERDVGSASTYICIMWFSKTYKFHYFLLLFCKTNLIIFFTVNLKNVQFFLQRLDLHLLSNCVWLNSLVKIFFFYFLFSKLLNIFTTKLKLGGTPNSIFIFIEKVIF